MKTIFVHLDLVIVRYDIHTQISRSYDSFTRSMVEGPLDPLLKIMSVHLGHDLNKDDKDIHITILTK